MRRRLATPGPTEVPQRLLLAGAREVIHHRSPEMERLVGEINDGLPPLFATTQPVYTLVASGTGAMEAAVANCFAAGDEVLVVSNGYFGERFQALCRTYGLTAHVVDSPWGTSADPAAVERAHRAHPAVRGVLVVHSETSAGALNDVERIAAIFRDTDAIVVVDAISGLIAHELNMDGWGLDVVLAASHKGFMLPPGLAFVALSEKAWRMVERVDSPTYYWSFTRLRQFHPMAASSPAVSLLLALHESLGMLRDEGLAAIQRRHATVAEATRRALEALGFELYVRPPHRPGNVVTVARTPAGLDANALLKTLSEEYGITMTGGQGELKGSAIRLGHIGAVDALDLFSIVGGVELALCRLGHRFDPGAGTGQIVRTFEEATAPC